MQRKQDVSDVFNLDHTEVSHSTAFEGRGPEYDMSYTHSGTDQGYIPYTPYPHPHIQLRRTAAGGRRTHVSAFGLIPHTWRGSLSIHSN